MFSYLNHYVKLSTFALQPVQIQVLYLLHCYLILGMLHICTQIYRKLSCFHIILSLSYTNKLSFVRTRKKKRALHLTKTCKKRLSSHF